MMDYKEYQTAREELLKQWDNDPDESLDDFEKWMIAKLTEHQAAFSKIEDYCQQTYDASLKEQLSLMTASFVLGAIMGIAHKALGKEIEE